MLLLSTQPWYMILKNNPYVTVGWIQCENPIIDTLLEVSETMNVLKDQPCFYQFTKINKLTEIKEKKEHFLNVQH